MPTDLKITSTPVVLVLEWGHPAEPNGKVTGYLVYVDGDLTVSLTESATKYVLSSLSSSQSYTVCVAAVNGRGEGQKACQTDSLESVCVCVLGCVCLCVLGCVFVCVLECVFVCVLECVFVCVLGCVFVCVLECVLYHTHNTILLPFSDQTTPSPPPVDTTDTTGVTLTFSIPEPLRGDAVRYLVLVQPLSSSGSLFEG